MFEKEDNKNFWAISSVYDPNCFRYFLIHVFLTKYLKKLVKKNFELYQVLTYNFLCQNDKKFSKILELYQVFV